MGRLGSSGRHVHSFVPLRSTGISPPSFADQSTTVAPRAILAGAALIAFWIFQAAERAGFVPIFISVF